MQSMNYDEECVPYFVRGWNTNFLVKGATRDTFSFWYLSSRYVLGIQTTLVPFYYEIDIKNIIKTKKKRSLNLVHPKPIIFTHTLCKT